MLLELDGRGPKYQQITRALVQAIRDGDLAPGTRVTASRTLARQLGCSRNVVLLAYDQVIAEGYFVSSARGGTFVSTELPLAKPARAADRAKPGPRARGGLSAAGVRFVRASDRAREIIRWPRPHPIDFIFGISEPDPRLVARVRRALNAALRERTSFFYGPANGDEGLRVEIARRLHGSRGIRRGADQIVITNGTQQALDLCARLLVGPGDRVIVEDPGYEAAQALFQTMGARLIPVPVDGEGLDPTQLPRKLRRARLVYVTPSHQSPTGGLLSVSRRRALLTWARSRGAYVIEDDYDGELRYSGQPVKALAGLDPDSDVIYCGSFAKSLFPSARLGYLALPEPLVAPFTSAKWLSDRGSSTLLQRLVHELMASGEYDRHIRRMQRRYASRRAALTRALTQYLDGEVELSGDETGMHLVAWFPRLTPTDVDALIAACRERGVGVYSVTKHALRRLPHGGLILGYGLIDEATIDAGVRKLAAAYRRVLTRVVRGRTPE